MERNIIIFIIFLDFPLIENKKGWGLSSSPSCDLFDIDSKTFDKELKFLGLIVFKNELKKHTKKTIENLKNADFTILISTGDNPFTSISVANKCRLFDTSRELYFCNLENSVENTKFIKFYKILLKPEEEIQVEEEKRLESVRSFTEYHKWNEDANSLSFVKKSFGNELNETQEVLYNYF